VSSFCVLTSRVPQSNSPAPAPLHTSLAEIMHTPPSPDSTSRANALLDSVLNSIQSQSTSSSTSTPGSSDTPSVEPFSSTDDSSSSKLPSSSSGGESREDDTSVLRYKALADALTEGVNSSGSSQDQPDPVPPEPIQSPEEDSGEATEVPASHSWRNPPAPVPAPVPTRHSVQLVRDVSKKAAAATAALKSPSLTKIGDEGTLRRRPTKRIDLQQISSPQFVSSSTSVNAIPLANTVSPQPPSVVPDPRSPLKLSQRFKKLRGTLRAKPSSRDGEEVVPFALPNAMDSSQTRIHRSPSPTAPAPAQTVMVSQHHDGPASATESGRFKVPVPTPPASAGPGLKGFMARFRKPRRDPAKESREHSGHQSPDSLSYISPANERGNAWATVSSSMAKPRQSEDQFSVNASRARSPTPDPATVNQFFNAASQLGLDREALDALLLARTTSTSSRRTTVTQSATAVVASRSNSTASKLPISRTREDHSLDRARTPESYKPPARPNATTNQHPDGEIVRRTIIFASDNTSTPDISGLARKDSPAAGRPQQSPSVAPDRSTATATREPPVPRLPAGLGRAHSTKPSESSSLYVLPFDFFFYRQSVTQGLAMMCTLRNRFIRAFRMDLPKSLHQCLWRRRQLRRSRVRVLHLKSCTYPTVRWYGLYLIP
jgi:serine/arginine repetitive matrix protein 2